ncbi:MAG: nuclear transport factor 2 family protein [Reichenbachiella sp.]
MIRIISFTIAVMLSLLVSCIENNSVEQRNIVKDTFPEEQQELIEVVKSIVRDAETANLEGLKDIHLASDKFTKFGPRNFERQGVEKTNESELAFFGTVSNYKEKVDDLKIDLFGEVGIATYYRDVSFKQNGEEKNVKLRQTLVFLKTDEGWKIVHEHGTKPIK